MATGQMNHTIRQMRRMAMLGFAGVSDAQLLDFFVTQKDDAAFEALVKRHGGMVLSVCRRILKDPHDAQDAFQATFLVLVRKAATLVKRELLGNWLYGVAFRAALKMKQAKRTRHFKERQVEPMAPRDSFEISDELLAGLDQEVNKLPDKYRAPLVFCDLEGMTRAQAANKLGWPIGTLNWRLARARSLVARGLERHGLTLGGAALAAVFQQSAAAAVPPALVASTVKLGTLMAAGGAMSLGVSAQVISLTEGVVKAMFLSKLKMPLAILVLMGSLGAGAGQLTYHVMATEECETQQAATPERQGENRHDALPIRAAWRDSLVTIKEKEGNRARDFITLTGDASLVDEDHKDSVKARRLHVWLESDAPKDSAAKNGNQAFAKGPGQIDFPATSRQKLRKLEAFEKVTLRSKSLIIHSANHLAIPFKNLPAASSQAPDLAPLPTNPATPTARTADPAKSGKPVELWANDVVAYMVTHGDKQELQELVAEGAVHVHQEGKESRDKKTKDKGVDITGDMLNLLRYPHGDVMYVFGDSRNPAQLQLGELAILGPKVIINQKDNHAEVEGAGAMSMLSDPEFGAGKAPQGKTRLIINWNKDMIFNGKDAEFHGGVVACQDSASLKCTDLHITLDRAVSFKEGQKESRDAKIEKLVCERLVLIVDQQKDSHGKWLRFDRLTATQLAIDNRDGRINASGPGKVEHLALGGADDPLQAPAPRANDKSAGAPQVMKLTRVLFEGWMFSTKNDKTRNAKFNDNVEVFHFPTENPDAKMNPDSPPKDGFYMRCKSLAVVTEQAENKSSQMMMAQGDVFFRTYEFFGTAAMVKYDEGKELVIFEGTADNPATLFRERPDSSAPDEIKGSKILYNRKTGIFEYEGGKVLKGR
jgi:RNA polymerase sigma factor (sigma-70 family)